MNPNEHTTTTSTVQPNIRSMLGVGKRKMFAGIQISIGVVCITACTQTVVIFNPVQERVIHTVTQLQGPNVNQHRVSYPQGYQQQYFMPNSHGQMMSWQFPGQVLLPMTQGSAESQQHNGMSNAGLSQQPWHMQSGLEQQANQGVNSQQKS
ncbi:unnamed protein product [Mytilus coruscus]|uniref:Uncharacterized protein n=1 Tax=Mytilus coruscus TaxID=42192 RepID=A0A6J8AUI8_MYTCO|nr:unnamed protein product [Mytilus coruscus]